MPKQFEKTIVISEAHLDSFKHMNNARYVELFEQARCDLITENGFGFDTIERTQTGPTILGMEMKFLKELRPRETVVIRSELVSNERKIGKMRQVMIKANGEIACEALFTFGLFDIAQRKLIDGRVLLVTWPSRSIRQQQDIGAAQGRVQKYFVGKSPEELRRHFKISAREASERKGTWHVDLVPTRKQLQEGVSRIELWIAQDTVLPRSMRLTFPNGDTKLMDFSEVRVNPVLPADTFSPRKN